MSIVEKLRSTRRCSQFDAAGRLIEFDGEPTPLELAAAERIAELEEAITKAVRVAGRNGMSEWPAFKALRKVMPSETRK